MQVMLLIMYGEMGGQELSKRNRDHNPPPFPPPLRPLRQLVWVLDPEHSGETVLSCLSYLTDSSAKLSIILQWKSFIFFWAKWRYLQVAKREVITYLYLLSTVLTVLSKIRSDFHLLQKWSPLRSLNCKYKLCRCWFGGVCDLTPYYLCR
jgi:hypothetical protein